MYCDGVTTQRAGLDFKLCHVQSKRGGGEGAVFLFPSFGVLPENCSYSLTKPAYFAVRGSQVRQYPSSLSLGHFLHRSKKIAKVKTKQFTHKLESESQAIQWFLPTNFWEKE